MLYTLAGWLAISIPGWAATKTWSGGSSANSSWMTAANWLGGAPGGGETLVFTGNTRLNTTNNFSGGTGWAGITFDANAGSFNVQGNGIFLQGDIINASGTIQNLLTFSGNGITLNGGDRTFYAQGGDINATSNISTAGNTLITQADAGRTMTLGGAIGGAGGVNKTGAGLVTLSGANTYTGTTTITSGTLMLGSMGALGSTARVAFASGSEESRLVAGIDGINVTAGIRQDGRGNYAVGLGNTLTLSGTISGAGGFVKEGNGTVVLGGVNTYTGTTFIASGTLAFSSAANFQGTDRIVFQGGGSQTSRLYATADGINLAKSITQTDPGNYVVDAGNTLTLSGTISGFGQFRKEGAGTIVLNAANDYSGRTVVRSGTLRLGTNGSINNQNMDFEGGVFDLNGKNQAVGDTVTIGTSTSSGVVLSSAGTGTMSAATFAVRSGTAAITLSGAAALTKTTTGTMTLSGSNNYSGGTVVSNGLLRLGGGGTTGSVAGNVQVDASGRLGFNRSNAYTFGGTIGGAGTVLQLGTGTTTFTANNSYQGGTTVEAGSLAVGHNSALGTGEVRVNGTGNTPSTQGTLLIGGTFMLGNNIALSGGEVERTLNSGAEYNLGTSGTVHSSFADSSFADTVAQILKSDTVTGAMVAYSMSDTPDAVVTNDDQRLSDVFHLDVSGDTADYYVLQLSLVGGTPEGFVAYRDGDLWVNAGTNFLGNIAYNGSTTVGDYGYTSAGAWVVLDHNSEFSIVPEPSAVALMLVGFGTLAARRRRR